MFKITRNEEFKDRTTSDHYLTITEGKFKDISFTFGKIEFLGEDTEGNGQVSFDYDLLQVPSDHTLSEDANLREELEGVLGGILHQILIEATSNNETGNPDSEQPAE